MKQTNQQEGIRRGDSGLALKAGFWYVFSSFVVKAIGFITTPIFSRLMSKTDYGEFSNFASWIGTLGIITGAELYNTLARAYYDHKEDFNKYASSVTVLGMIITGAVMLVFLLCKDFIYNVVTIPPQYTYLLFGILLCQGCKQIFMARERTLYRYKKVAALSFFNLLIPTLMAVALVVLFPNADRLASRLYGFYVPSAIVGVGCGIAVLARGRSFKLTHCKYALALSLPMLAHYFTAYLLNASNTIVTKSVLGAESAAMVSIANSAIHILTVFFQSVSGAVTTWVMDNLDQKNTQKLKKDALLYIALLAIVATSVILFAPEVVQVLGGSSYAESVTLIPGFVLAIFIQSATTLFTIILTYDKNIVKTAVWTGIVAVLSVAAKVLFLPKTGYLGLAYINIVAFGVLFVINYLLVRKAGYGDAVHVKGMSAIVLGMVCITVLGLVLYPHTWLRYGVVAVFIVAAGFFAVKKKNTILSLLRKKKKKQ